mgnify:CR=1 FL=1
MKVSYIFLFKQIPTSFIKYIIVGVSNAIFTTLIYIIALYIFHLKYTISFTISWIMGLLYTYIINYIYVFKPNKKLEFKGRLWKYATIYIISYIVSILLLKLAVEHYKINSILAQLIIIPFIVIINYSGINFWVMKSKN